jgi:hypothetical protein
MENNQTKRHGRRKLVAGLLSTIVLLPETWTARA